MAGMIKNTVKTLIGRFGYRIIKQDTYEQMRTAVKENILLQQESEKSSESDVIADIVKGIPSTIQWVMIGPTFNCNFRCFFCGIHSWRHPAGKSSDPCIIRFYKDKSSRIMPFELCKEVIDDLARLNTETIEFSGWGEPLLHPKIVEMINYAVKRKIRCTMTTNGSLLNEKKIDELIDAGLGMLSISVNTLNPSVYKNTHGINNGNVLERLMKSIAYLSDPKVRNPQFQLTCRFAMSKLNYKEVGDFHEFGKQHHVDNMLYVPYHGIPCAADYVLDEHEVDDIIAELRLLTGDDHSMFKEVWCQSHFANRISLPCFTGFLMSFINSNGDVIPCCGCRYSMGNVREERFYDIWTSNEYKEFRHKALLFHKGHEYPEQCDCDICPDPHFQRLRLGTENCDAFGGFVDMVYERSQNQG